MHTQYSPSYHMAEIFYVTNSKTSAKKNHITHSNRYNNTNKPVRTRKSADGLVYVYTQKPPHPDGYGGKIIML